jgi:hypothetical protein
MEHPIDLDLRTQIGKGKEMSIQAPAPDYIPSRRREHYLPDPGQQRPCYENGSSNLSGKFLGYFIAFDILGVEFHRILLDPFHLNTEGGKDGKHHIHVFDFGNVP